MIQEAPSFSKQPLLQTKFPGTFITYKSSYVAHKKTVIVVPSVCNVKAPYELIYFFHGNGGYAMQFLKPEKFGPAMRKQILECSNNQKKNIAVVFMQLGSKPGDGGGAWASGKGNFDSFHKEVVSKIKKELGGSDPSFVTLKGHSAGGGAIKSCLKNCSAGLQSLIKRIDYLDASYGWEQWVVKTAMKERLAKKDIEINFFVNPKRKEYNTIKKWVANPISGVNIVTCALRHFKIPVTFFAYKSTMNNTAAIKGGPGNIPSVKSSAATVKEGSSPTNPSTTSQTPTTGAVSSTTNCSPPSSGGSGDGSDPSSLGVHKTKVRGTGKPRAVNNDLKASDGCTKSRYYAHVSAQKSAALKQHNSTPALASKKGEHKGVNNIIFQGKQVSCPFKVVRYDGTVPGFKRKVSGGGKAWWDPKNPESKKRNALSKVKGGLGGGWFRKASRITHFTMHNYGSVKGKFKPGAGVAATFASKGWMGHFAIDTNGQIFQTCDASIRTSHNGGSGLKPRTSTNGFSIGIDFLDGCAETSLGAATGGKKSGWKNKGRTPSVAGKVCLRRFNQGGKWNRPSMVSSGPRAMHEACYALIKFLSTITGIKHRYAAVDGRLDSAQLRKSRVQSHYQLQNNRLDGMSYIWWAWATGKPGAVKSGFGSAWEALSEAATAVGNAISKVNKGLAKAAGLDKAAAKAKSAYADGMSFLQKSDCGEQKEGSS